jgi:DNA-binding transcriptional LysR family regulator
LPWQNARKPRIRDDPGPTIGVSRIEAGVPEQFKPLVEGRLDIGLGRASLAPTEIASELVRLDPLGVLVAEDHRFAAGASVPVATLATEPLLLGSVPSSCAQAALPA